MDSIIVLEQVFSAIVHDLIPTSSYIIQIH